MSISDKSQILKAQSPAALAEEYIVKSIWNQLYPAGTDLPAERELADKIGVTRTTLREVLQRLARDGWLTIQHGKPTRVNNIWETAGPNFITTLISLDPSSIPMVIENVVSLRTRMVEFYVPKAVELDAMASATLFSELEALQDTAEDYANFDYELFRRFTFIANKPVYGLILNSFKDLYKQTARLFFENKFARHETFNFYYALKMACENGNSEQASECIAKNRQKSSEMWAKILQDSASAAFNKMA